LILQVKKTLIGINSDVTEQYLNNLILEERNRELEQSNKELASFNHVASHDLQEPLRKILTFISRISETETAGMSESSKEYLSRIKISATRMRILIDDLLLFSRTNKTEKVFEKSDLNLLLELAQQDLAQIIEEKNAIIKSVLLPQLTVIPFQIQQLFTNLISNSLKYSKKNHHPAH
jgi:light-regulated signal transduction histidine kinase (bacteriophytochrome)